MREAPEYHRFSIRVVILGALASAALTWLCVGWFGAQGPLTAAIAVILVELFLACVGMIAILLAARISDTYLQLESRWPEQPAHGRRLWLWRPIWQPSLRWDRHEQRTAASEVPVESWRSPVNAEMQPSGSPETVPFSIAAAQSPGRADSDPPLPRRRAA